VKRFRSTEATFHSGTKTFVEIGMPILKDDLRISLHRLAANGRVSATATHISYDEAERLRDWLNEWLVENWPQEEDDETTAD
jgi:hypothetical protein